MGELMPFCLSGHATPAQQESFQMLWQDWVQRLLLEHAADPDVIRIFR
jgi:hypothetical protein